MAEICLQTKMYHQQNEIQGGDQNVKDIERKQIMIAIDTSLESCLSDDLKSDKENCDHNHMTPTDECNKSKKEQVESLLNLEQSSVAKVIEESSDRKSSSSTLPPNSPVWSSSSNETVSSSGGVSDITQSIIEDLEIDHVGSIISNNDVISNTTECEFLTVHIKSSQQHSEKEKQQNQDEKEAISEYRLLLEKVKEQFRLSNEQHEKEKKELEDAIQSLQKECDKSKSWEKELGIEIQHLQEEHGKALELEREKISKALAEEHRQNVQVLQNQHKDQHEQLQSEFDAQAVRMNDSIVHYEKIIHDLKKDNCTKLLHQKEQFEHSIRCLQEQCDKECKSWEMELKTEVLNLQEQHKKELQNEKANVASRLNAEFQTAFDSLQSHHENEIQELHSKLKSQKDKFDDENTLAWKKCQVLENQYDNDKKQWDIELQQRLESEHQKHQEILSEELKKQRQFFENKINQIQKHHFLQAQEQQAGYSQQLKKTQCLLQQKDQDMTSMKENLDHFTSNLLGL